MMRIINRALIYKTILAALDTLGEDIEVIQKIIERRYGYRVKNWEKISIGMAFYISEILAFDSLAFFQFGYNKKVHEILIWESCKNGNFLLTKNNKIKSLVERIQKEKDLATATSCLRRK